MCVAGDMTAPQIILLKTSTRTLTSKKMSFFWFPLQIYITEFTYLHCVHFYYIECVSISYFGYFFLIIYTIQT